MVCCGIVRVGGYAPARIIHACGSAPIKGVGHMSILQHPGISPGSAADVTHIVKKWDADETSAKKGGVR
jgi:hypothetical protein